MFKRLALLAMSLAAVTAFAAPPVAQAEGWTMEGSPLAENGTLTMTGHLLIFAGPSGGFNCLMKAMWTLEPGNTGRIDSYETDGAATSVCAVSGGLKQFGCKIEKVEPTGLPWTIHWKSTSAITVTTGEIHLATTGCALEVPSITLTPGSVDLRIAETEMSAITTGSFEGVLTAHFGILGTQTATIASSGVTLSEGSGTFGI